MFDHLLKNIAEESLDFSKNYEFGHEGSYLYAEGVDFSSINIETMTPIAIALTPENSGLGATELFCVAPKVNKDSAFALL